VVMQRNIPFGPPRLPGESETDPSDIREGGGDSRLRLFLRSDDRITPVHQVNALRGGSNKFLLSLKSFGWQRAAPGEIEGCLHEETVLGRIWRTFPPFRRRFQKVKVLLHTSAYGKEICHLRFHFSCVSKDFLRASKSVLQKCT
jgi:hypothetical protein